MEDGAQTLRPLRQGGVWERVFAHLIRDPDNDYASLDSSLVRARQQAAAGKGRAIACVGRRG